MHSHDEEAKFMTDLREAAPDMVSAFFAFDKAVFSKSSGNLGLTTRELIAVGVAVTTQCAYCIADHANVQSELVHPSRMSRRPS
jgi:alkylhydroperoxidase/carboxymuconolactone decarboxylase family protein YurZ